MDGNWREWRHFEKFWDEFEEKGWDLGPVKHVNLPPVLAEYGPYRLVFRYWEPDTDESLFEVRLMHEGEEQREVLVWGIPTPGEAESLLARYGVDLDEPQADITSGPPAASEGLWGGILPPVVYADWSRQAHPR